MALLLKIMLNLTCEKNPYPHTCRIEVKIEAGISWNLMMKSFSLDTLHNERQYILCTLPPESFVEISLEISVYFDY